MIDVVYKLGPKFRCDWDNYEELRYSLRSLSYFKELGNVWIVGSKPDWIKNVRHVPMVDAFTCKDSNIINKLIRVCLHEDLSENFLQFSDDQFLLTHCTIQDFMYPVKSNLQFEIENRGVTEYKGWQKQLIDTCVLLHSMDLPFDKYEAHCPYLINKRLYPGTMIKYSFEDQKLCGNTLYFNTIGAIGRSGDVVKRVTGDDADDLLLKPEHLFFNYTSRAFRENPEIKRFIKFNYNYPSRYE